MKTTVKNKTRTWEENESATREFELMYYVLFIPDFILSSFVSALVVPVLDQEQNKAIAVLLVS